MGAVSCRQGQGARVAAPHKQGGNIQGPWTRGWKSFWSGVGTTRSGLEELWGLWGLQYLHQEPLEPAPLLVEKSLSEWPVPQFINLFLPEFPIRPLSRQQQLKRQISHPFVHSLGDSWQGKRHLFIMCSYCSRDLYSLWSTVGCFAEASISIFAAELVLVLCYLHDLGIIHRDVKFPVSAENDHVAMLASVTHCDYEIPSSLNQQLSLLLQELLSKNPCHRPRYLHHFQVHPFFRGVAFDPELLQKQPMNFVMEAQATQPSSPESMLFKDFDYELKSFLVRPSPA
ncbi:ribosomal protein S6 kinase-related protein isoform 3-T3 [Dugong dugon]